MKTQTLFSPLDKRKVVGMGDLARATGISLQTLRDQTVKGEIPGSFRLGPPGKGRRWRFHRLIVEEWWAKINRETSR